MAKADSKSKKPVVKDDQPSTGLARAKALSEAVSQIEKSFGKGSIMRLGDGDQAEVPVISTGSISLDAALGIGGIPRGRVVEIYGPESSGKTTLALHVVAEAQKAKNPQGQAGVAAFIDAEHALDVSYASRLGVDVKELLVSQPDSGEQALNIAEILVRSGAVDLVVIDSVAALVPEAEIQGDMGDSHVGLQARLMSQALRKLTSVISRSQCSVVFINQIRQKIGPMVYGNPEVTTGGNALKFYASLRIEIRRGAPIKGPDDLRVGNEARVKVVKNTMAPPFREAVFEILFGKGISREGELLDLGVAADLVEKSGSWYSFDGERIGNGKESSRAFLKSHPEVASAIEERLRSSYRFAAAQAAEAATGENPRALQSGEPDDDDPDDPEAALPPDIEDESPEMPPLPGHGDEGPEMPPPPGHGDEGPEVPPPPKNVDETPDEPSRAPLPEQPVAAVPLGANGAFDSDEAPDFPEDDDIGPDPSVPLPANEPPEPDITAEASPPDIEQEIGPESGPPAKPRNGKAPRSGK
jgi:recombination protein RecA